MSTATRRVWFVRPDEVLRCPLGHVIRVDWELPEDGFPRCRHDTKGVECGRRIYALTMARRGGRALTLVADVSGPEIRALLARTATVDDILEALGLTWPSDAVRQGMPPPALVTGAVRR